jgi:hypothetical protein
LARWTTLLLVFGALAALMVAAGVRPASANFVINVTAGIAEGTNGDGDTNCSLREAVDMARTNVVNTDCPIVTTATNTLRNVVYVPAGTYILNPANGPLVVGANMRLRGQQTGVPAAPALFTSPYNTRPIVPGTESIIQYNGTVNNLGLINMAGGDSEVEGLVLRGGTGTQTDVYGIVYTTFYPASEITNNIFTDLTAGILLLPGPSDTTDISGNAFQNLTRPASAANAARRGSAVFFTGIRGGNVQIEANLFKNLPSYAIHVPTLFTGVFPMADNVIVTNNMFNSVRSAVRTWRNDTVVISNNVVNTTGGGTVTPAAVFEVNNTDTILINNNEVISTAFPAVRTLGVNTDVEITYNRFYETDLSGSGNAVVIDLGSIDPGFVLSAADIRNNWWGDNDGPGAGVNGFSADLFDIVTPMTWLAYGIVASPSAIGFSSTNPYSEIYGDFFSTDDGVTELNPLAGVTVLSRDTALSISLPIVPSPIGTLSTGSPGSVFLDGDVTTVAVFNSDNVSAGTQNINLELDNEIVTYSLSVTAGAQVVCDFNDGQFNDPAVMVTMGETIGDRCVLRLTQAPVSGFVDVLISSADAATLGFLNQQATTPPLTFTSPPNASFAIRFGLVRNSAAVPPVVKWDDGVAINFVGLTGGTPGYYPALAACAIQGTTTATNYSAGACPGLDVMPVSVYSAGIDVAVVNSDPDLLPGQTDICTFNFSRTYQISLSGPPGLRAAPPNPLSTEIVTVTTTSSAPTRVNVTAGGTLNFNRSDWFIGQSISIARVSTPVTAANQPSVTISHLTSSDLNGAPGTDSPYNVGLTIPLTVINPLCPLLGDKDSGMVDVGIAQSVSSSEIRVGDIFQYNYSFWGSGLAGLPASQAGVIVNIDIPAGAIFMGINDASAPYCAIPNEGTAGPVTVSCVFPADIAVNGGAFSLSAMAGTTGSLMSSANIASFMGSDIDASNNASSASVVVN